MDHRPKIDRHTRLYIIRAGSGYTTLGWDVAESRRVAYLRWLGEPPERLHRPGTLAAYRAYLRALNMVRQRCARTATRCDAELIPELQGLEGRRVEVTAPDGSRERYQVGRSTGCLPLHLALHNSRSRGGLPVRWEPGSTVRAL